VPVVGIDGDWTGCSYPLISLKTSELSAAEGAALVERVGTLDEDVRPRLFLHERASDEVTRQLVERAEIVYVAQADALEPLGDVSCEVRELWAPGLIADARRFEPTEISVFSFGMAHKVQVERFERLRELLEKSEREYALYISNANHETASERDAEAVYEEMSRIFPRRLYFLGTLSDVAVYNYLTSTTFFASFFPEGVRANNTSVASAMEHGAVVVTNLDERSPAHLEHLGNLIDIERCAELPTDPLTMRQISVRAMETARERSWDRLVESL